MSYANYIPWIISFLTLVVSFCVANHNFKKDNDFERNKEEEKIDGIKESLLKANIKLDQVCATTNETRTDIKTLNNDMQAIDRRLTVVERDLKTAFKAIDEVKGVISDD